MTGQFDELWFKNMMLACLGHLNIQWDWPRCPKTWHSRHLSCWVFNVWSRQVWHIHACNKNKITTFYGENIWQLCCQNLFHMAITISKTNVGSSSKSLKKHFKKTSEHFETTWFLLLSTRFISFLLPEFQEAHPITKSRSLNNKYTNTTQHPKAQHENQLPMYEPLPSPRQSHSQNDPKTLPRPRPSLRVASTLAPAEISCSTTAAWPFRAAQCSAVRPRAPRMRRGRRGQLRLPSRNKAYIVMGCFSGLLGKYFWIGHR